MSTKSDKPWNHAPKSTSAHHRLSKGQKQAAKARAKKAHRAYPNLVDNMNAARRS
jgi:hypothetical protein